MGTFNTGPTPNGILTKALTGNIYVEKNLAFMNEGNKDGYTAYKHDIKNVLRARSTNPALTVNNTSAKQAFKRNLVVVESFETFDPSEYEQYWLEYQPSGVFDWQGLPTKVQATLEELFLGSAVEATEAQLTIGDGTLILGLIPQLEDPSLTNLDGGEATVDQTVNNTAIGFVAHAGGSGDTLSEVFTAANIFDILELAIRKQNKRLRKRPGRKFMCSHATADMIRAAQRGAEFKGVEFTEEGVMRYGGFDIIENPSFEDNKLVFCSMTGDFKTDAIQLGTSLSTDHNNLTVARADVWSRDWGMLLTFALDIYVVRPEEVVFYTSATIV